MARTNGGRVLRSEIRRLKRSFLFLLVGCASFTSYSQEASGVTHFFLNPYLLNSSYAGIDGQASASLVYRNQWMTIDGAPTITSLSLHAPLNNRVSAGINISNDAKGFFNNSSLLFSVAYHVPVADHTFMRFGISAGGSWNTVDMQKLEAINDNALASVLDQHASLTGNAGVSLHHRSFNFGIALPTIFSPAYVSEDAFKVKEIKPFESMIAHASNRFYFNDDKNIFEPYLVYRITKGLPSQLELAGLVHLNHMVWVGGSYKEDFGISALGGIKMKNVLAVGASYSLPNGGEDQLNSPTFEISVNYLFGLRKRNLPVYSFVNAERIKEKAMSPAARQALAAKQAKEKEEQKAKADAAARARQEQLEEKKRIAAEAAAKKKDVQESEAERQQRVKQEVEAKKQEAADERARQIALAEEKKKSAEQARLEREARIREQAAAKKQEEEDRKAKQAELAAQKKIEAERAAEQKRLDQEARAKAREEQIRVEREAAAQREAERKARAEQAALEKQKAREEADAAKNVTSSQESPVLSKNDDSQDLRKDEAQLEKLQQASQNPGVEVDDTTAPTLNVRHETVKRGDHESELPAGEYVVAGEFKLQANARHFADGLLRLNYNAQLGYLSAKKLWYVYLYKTANAEQARAQQARYSKLFLLRDAWLLTVEP